jgi:hypothetical protein
MILFFVNGKKLLVRGVNYPKKPGKVQGTAQQVDKSCTRNKNRGEAGRVVGRGNP